MPLMCLGGWDSLGKGWRVRKKKERSRKGGRREIDNDKVR